MTRQHQRRLLGLTAVFLFNLSAAVRAQEVVAVLSSAPGPYQAAFDSFKKVFGGGVVAYHLPQERPEVGAPTRVVVAFGAEAAVQSYPKRTAVIACLAPGLPQSPSREGSFVFIAMKPPAPILLAQLKRLQPRLKRLAVLWNAAYTGVYLKELQRAADAQGIELETVRVAGVAGVPDALRGLAPKPDALWLAPDPELITPESFQTIKQFSWDNSIPFYAPTAGLAAAGAAAALSVSVEEMGRQAAERARLVLSGKPLPEVSFSEKTKLTVNLGSAAKAGLKISPEALGQADQVIH